MSVVAPSGEPKVVLGGEPPTLPDGTPIKPKLPPGKVPDGFERLPDDVKDAWTRYMVNGFQQNEEMFNRTLSAFMKPYRLTLWLYGALFTVGLVLVITAAIAGLMNEGTAVPLVFVGLGTAAFLAFFIRQPTQALEENLEFITWLGVAFNTYWTRLMYIQNEATVQDELKQANDDFITSVERLIDKHATLRGKRPGNDLKDDPTG